MSDGQPVNLLVLPRLRVQNANAIASPLTWGFPAMSAFMGFMHALERRLPAEQKLLFEQVGVICHDFQPQTASAGYNLQQFNLTRNPVGKDGKTLGIAEEGRMHMEISLVFDVTESDDSSEAAARNLKKSEQEKIRLAAAIDDIVHGMRIAGGSVLPRTHQRHKPQLIALSSNPDDAERTFRRLCRQLLPGFALVLNEQALRERLEERRATDPDTSPLDAWLDFSRLQHECRIDEETGAGQWQIRDKAGWLVPIPVGYRTLSAHEPGEVARARDPDVPFRFVEGIYSVGQWVSPHRLQSPQALMWYLDADPDNSIYRLNNDYIDS